MGRNTPQDSLLSRVKQAIQRHHLLEPGDHVLAAVSGGLDSMVLLHALVALGYTVEAAHFDHQTREGQSTEDAGFVRQACAQLNIPCHSGTEPVAENARRSALSFEAYARDRRYAFLAGMAEERGCAAVATGHQRDDQVETVLLGLFGLASDLGPGGFAAATRFNDVPVIRPLIGCGRDMIQAWAEARGITWREDSTNQQPLYRRNRLRMAVMPLLDESVRNHVARFSEILRSDTAFLDGHAASLLDTLLRPCAFAPGISVLDTVSFRAFPEAVRRHALKVLAHRCGIPFSFDRCLHAEVFLLDAAAGSWFHFGQGAALYMGRDGAHLLTSKNGSLRQPVLEGRLVVPGTTRAGAYTFETRLLQADEAGPGSPASWNKQCRQYFDWDSLQKPLCLRAPKTGDVFRPFGMPGTRKVREVMAECDIPAYLRDAVPLITAQDTILWVTGCRRGADAPILASTATILEIQYQMQALNQR